MMRLLGFAAIAGLALTSAAPPPVSELESVVSPGPYPPCSRGVTDGCVQTYEREVRESQRSTANQGGPLEPVTVGTPGYYPPCSATLTDRCTQRGGARHIRTARMRRAGERG